MFELMPARQLPIIIIFSQNRQGGIFDVRATWKRKMDKSFFKILQSDSYGLRVDDHGIRDRRYSVCSIYGPKISDEGEAPGCSILHGQPSQPRVHAGDDLAQGGGAQGVLCVDGSHGWVNGQSVDGHDGPAGRLSLAKIFIPGGGAPAYGSAS